MKAIGRICYVVTRRRLLLHPPFEPLARPLLSIWQTSFLPAPRPGPKELTSPEREKIRLPTRSSLRTFLLRQPVSSSFTHTITLTQFNFFFLLTVLKIYFLCWVTDLLYFLSPHQLQIGQLPHSHSTPFQYQNVLFLTPEKDVLLHHAKR